LRWEGKDAVITIAPASVVANERMAVFSPPGGGAVTSLGCSVYSHHDGPQDKHCYCAQ